MWYAYVIALLPHGMYSEGNFLLEVSRTAHEPANPSSEDGDVPSLVCSYGITTTTVGGMFGFRASQRCGELWFAHWLAGELDGLPDKC